MLPAPLSAPAFAITEYGTEDLTIELTGRALPFRPFTLEGEQRGIVTWYPGSPTGSLQTLGPKEQPTTIKGRWDDLFFANGDAAIVVSANSTNSMSLPDVVSATREIDELRRRGRPLMVSWDRQVRHGYLKRFTQRWRTTVCCEWEMEFEWTAVEHFRDAAPLKAVSRPDSSAIDKARATLDAAFGPLLPGAPGGPEETAAQLAAQFDPAFGAQNIVASIIGKIGSEIDDVHGAVNRYSDAVNGYVVQGTSTMTALAGLVSLPSDIIDSTGALIRLIEGEAIESYFGAVDSGLAIGEDFGLAIASAASTAAAVGIGVGPVLSVAQTMRRASSGVRALRNTAAREQANLLASVQPDVVDTYTAMAGDDMRHVSTTFYGTPDEWKFLMAYNGLRPNSDATDAFGLPDPSALRAGQVVYVPRDGDAARQPGAGL